MRSICHRNDRFPACAGAVWRSWRAKGEFWGMGSPFAIGRASLVAVPVGDTPMIRLRERGPPGRP